MHKLSVKFSNRLLKLTRFPIIIIMNCIYLIDTSLEIRPADPVYFILIDLYLSHPGRGQTQAKNIIQIGTVV